MENFNFVSRIKTWFSEPAKGNNGDVLDWVLFLGFVAVVSMFWNRVLRNFNA